MTALHDLLDRASGEAIEVDVAADLRRGHRALTRRRQRVAAGVTGGLVAAGVVGYAVVPRAHSTVAQRPSDPGPTALSPSPPVEPQFFDVPPPPAGWHVVGDTPQYVMIGRDGGDTKVDSSFVGNLVVMLGDGSEHYGDGSPVHYDDRTFYVNEQNDDATILAVRTPDGDWLQLQYPPSEFGVPRMVVYLDGVVSKHGAEQAQG
jgi:hypothetical protein